MKTISLKTKKIIGISVTVSSKNEILEEIQKYLFGKEKRKGKVGIKPLVIATPNPEQIVLAQADGHFAKLLNQADVAIPDGAGLAWALGVARIPGVELMEDLAALAAKRGVGIGLIGGRAGVAVKALECLRGKYPGLVGWAEEPGEVEIRPIRPASPKLQRGEPITQSDQWMQEIAREIRKTNTRLVFVGLGAPKQEYFIARLARQFSIFNFQFPIVFMSVGGAFDMIAGRVPRAPAFIRNAGLEWLWRLLREPWRLQRQLAILKFLWFVIWEKVV